MARHPLYHLAAWAIGLLMIALFPSAAWAFEVRVCVRPPGVGTDVGKWFWNYENKLKTVMGDEGAFRVKSRDHIVFVYDPWAPPESANHFRDQWPKITCPKPKAPPKPAAAPPPPKPPPPAQPPPKKEEKPKDAGLQAGSDGKPPTAEELAKREEERRRWDGRGGTVGDRPLPKEEDEGALSDHCDPPKDYKDEPGSPVEYRGGFLPAMKDMKDGKRPMLSVVSCHQRKAGCKTTVQKIVEQVVIGGAIFNLQMGEDLHRADGQPFGIVGGMNADGPNDPLLQAVAAVVLLTPVQQLGNGFMKRVADASAKGEKVIVAELKELTEEAAEQLMKDHGGEVLTQALAKEGTVGPYKVWKKFTEGLESRWQAHHILEQQMFERFGIKNPNMGPAVILSKAEHQAITNRLRELTASAESLEELWQGYLKAYKAHPEWLTAMKSYFPFVK